MKYTKMILGFSALLFFSGCSWSDIPFIEDEKNLEISAHIYVEMEGEILAEKSSQFSFLEYFLLNAENEKVAKLISQTENLEEFSGKNVFVKGEKTKNDSSLLTLNVVQIAISSEKNTEANIPELGISLPLSSQYEYEFEKGDGRLHIIQKKTGEKFCTFFLQQDEKWQEKFLEKGEKIVVQDFDVRRIYAGKRIQLFFPTYNIQVNYWGEENGEYDFYTLLDRLYLSQKTEKSSSKNSLKNGEKKSSQEKEEENGDEEGNSENSEKTQNPEISQIIAQAEKIIETRFPEKKYGVHKIALYKEFVDVEIFDIDEKKRLVFEMQKSENSSEITLSEVAEYKEGEVQSWELVSGETPALAGKSEIFLIDINDTKPIVLPENFALYLSTHFDFQVGYPRGMYYKATGGNAEKSFLAKVEWAKSPVTPENAEIRLEILSGEISEEKKLPEDGMILIPRNDKTHFKFSALHDNFDVIEEMRKNFRSEK